MTAVTFPLRPPRLAFAICGWRWHNDLHENKVEYYYYIIINDVIRVLRWYIPNSLRLAGNYAHIFVFGYCLNLFFKVQGFLSSTLRKLFTSFSLKEDQFVNKFLGQGVDYL